MAHPPPPAYRLAGGVDLVRGELLAAPLAAVFGGAFLAGRYETLWLRG